MIAIYETHCTYVGSFANICCITRSDWLTVWVLVPGSADYMLSWYSIHYTHYAT